MAEMTEMLGELGVGPPARHGGGGGSSCRVWLLSLVWAGARLRDQVPYPVEPGAEGGGVSGQRGEASPPAAGARVASD